MPALFTARCRVATVVLATTGAFAACGPSEPRTDAERLARGRELMQLMSDKLSSTNAFTVTTTEARDEVAARGTERVKVTRETTIRRPDRLYSKASGSHQNEVWYDGVGITVVIHEQKVFSQARAPETLDKTLDAIHERFGVPTPLADYAYSSPVKAFLTDATTGGWVACETLDNQPVEHLAFKDKGVAFEIWFAAAGDPLPLKSIVEFTEEGKQVRRTELTFSNWNLSPQFPESRFDPTVPADYEGIAILQRARALRHLPKEGDEPSPPTQPRK